MLLNADFHHFLRAGRVAYLATLSLMVVAHACAQDNPPTCTTPSGAVDSPTSSTGSFNSNFANSTYEIPLTQVSGQNAAGDLNSTYYQFFYSIQNMNNWMTANGYCPVELVLVGTFPNARYFSVTSNDMHYASTQHLSDQDIDPRSSTVNNPYAPSTKYRCDWSGSGSTAACTGDQNYVIPISLGTVPNQTSTAFVSGCGIDPFEEDNLIDATQRHPGMDWNMNVASAMPSVNSGLSPHILDLPDHSMGNLAGGILVRSYITETCTAGTCTQGQNAPQPYMIVRDTKTGCAYHYAPTGSTPSYLAANLLNTASLACYPYSPTCACSSSGSNPQNCNAIVSTTDLAAAANPANTAGQTSFEWMDETQHEQHTFAADATPQSCYANGASSTNKVAWTRGPEWVGSPGPDDAYVGGGVISTDLQAMVSGTACTQQNSGDGCVMRFQFQVPSVPSTPCTPDSTGTSQCYRNGSEQLRYMSLTFGQQPVEPSSPDDFYVANPDGVNAGTVHPPKTIISIADKGFVPDSNGNVTLLVNVGTTLPSWLQASNGTAIPQWLQPTTNTTGGASVWQVNHCSPQSSCNYYTVVDLSKLNNFSTTNDLQLTIRTTLPNTTSGSAFTCSGAAVPFSTAEWMGSNTGLMGPYAPMVDYVDPNSLANAPAVSGLPSCVSLPSGASAEPGINQPTLSNLGDCSTSGFGITTPANCINWPVQYFSSTQGAPPNLYCASTSNSSAPQIDFVGSQFSSPAVTWASSNSQNCATADTSNTCSQIVAQSPQSSEWSGGSIRPPVPLTIVGSGFGYLPGVSFPFMLGSCTSCAPSLKIVAQNNAQTTTLWDTSNGAQCQIYVANWNDTAITLFARVPINAWNDYYGSSIYISPLTDFSPLTLFKSFAATPQNTLDCDVLYNDKLTFTVTTSQGSYTTQAITVAAAGTTTH